ncbi:MAG: hypothetical protein JJU05_00975 [Verrucomicrobia bacterium]|nr:hypothetical protein [Verrucomicrobiota bacterium]MCH8525943.1 hypothetical protein [Kiritimatiellia bacterium]
MNLQLSPSLVPRWVKGLRILRVILCVHLVVSLLLGLFVFRPRTADWVDYKVGEDYYQMSVMYHYPDWFEYRLKEGTIPSGFRRGLHRVYLWPVGKIWHRLLSEKRWEPEHIQNMEAFARKHDLQEGVRCFFKDIRLKEVVIQTPEGDFSLTEHGTFRRISK